MQVLYQLSYTNMWDHSSCTLIHGSSPTIMRRVVLDSGYGPHGHCDPSLNVQVTLTGRLTRADRGFRTLDLRLTKTVLYP